MMVIKINKHLVKEQIIKHMLGLKIKIIVDTRPRFIKILDVHFSGPFAMDIVFSLSFFFSSFCMCDKLWCNHTKQKTLLLLLVLLLCSSLLSIQKKYT